jgi:hypothetical protein
MRAEKAIGVGDRRVDHETREKRFFNALEDLDSHGCGAPKKASGPARPAYAHVAGRAIVHAD